MTARRIAAYLWALPSTAIGLLLACFAFAAGATARIVDGVLEVGGGKVAFCVSLLPRPCRFNAITLGHVIIGADHATLCRLRIHERVHVRQYERWGLLFFPIYLGSSCLQLMRGRHPYYDNFFERDAFDHASADPSRHARSA